jgi:hypothetical protein
MAVEMTSELEEQLKEDIKSGASLELIHSATGIDMGVLISLEAQALEDMFGSLADHI